MKKKSEILKKIEDLKDYYVAGMNGGIKFSQKDKYVTQGKIDALCWIIDSSTSNTAIPSGHPKL